MGEADLPNAILGYAQPGWKDKVGYVKGDGFQEQVMALATGQVKEPITTQASKDKTVMDVSMPGMSGMMNPMMSGMMMPRCTIKMEKTKDGWKIIHDHSSAS